jgi:hypothetical protein
MQLALCRGMNPVAILPSVLRTGVNELESWIRPFGIRAKNGEEEILLAPALENP